MKSPMHCVLALGIRHGDIMHYPAREGGPVIIPSGLGAMAGWDTQGVQSQGQPLLVGANILEMY